MLYTTASVDWRPGSPLVPGVARPGLSRMRPDPGSTAAGRPTLAVAVRYDAMRGEVVAVGPVARALVGPWTAPAIVDDQGAVTVLAAIPAVLVRVVGPSETRVHPGRPWRAPRPRRLLDPASAPQPRPGGSRVVNGLRTGDHGDPGDSSPTRRAWATYVGAFQGGPVRGRGERPVVRPAGVRNVAGGFWWRVRRYARERGE